MKRYYLIIFLVFVLVNLILLWKFNNTKRSLEDYQFLNESLKESIREKETEINKLIFQLEENIDISNQHLLPDSQLKLLYKESFEKLLSGNKNIIFRIPENSCGSCVNQVLELLRNENYPKESDLVLMAQDSSFLIKNSLEYPVAIIPQLPLDFEKNQMPYFFSIDKTFTTNNGFIPDDKRIDLTRAYLKNFLR